MSNIAFELDQEQEPIAKIKVVGVGGAGGNAIRRMIDSGLSHVEFIAVNTDEQVLHRSGATTQICIGANVTKTLGAGGRPEVGRQAIEEDRDQVADALSAADMVFITAGMGGGTGTGASPVVADLAREAGALTVGVVTTPFLFEGSKRMRRAAEGLAELRKVVDTLIVISNERLMQVLPGKTPINDSFREADNVLRQAVQGITDIILVPGLVNLDFNDVRTIMSHRGSATMGMGTGVGEERAQTAARAAISSPLLEDVCIAGAKGLLVNVSAGPSLSLDDVRNAMKVINDAAGDGADIFFGAVIDETMPEDELRVTLIATGIETQRTELEGELERTATGRDQQPARRPARAANPNDLTVPAFQRRQQPADDEAEEAETEKAPFDDRRSMIDDPHVPAFIRKPRRRI